MTATAQLLTPTTAFEEYFGGIVAGEIVACEKIKAISAKLMDARFNPGKYHYDPAIAQRHVDFIQNFCCVPRGRLGAPLKLELFQEAITMAIFGFVDDDGNRQYQEVMIVMGRKNGKTTWAAALELDLLINDGEGAPSIYNVATKHDQAMEMFTRAHTMVRFSPHLRKHVRKRMSDLFCHYNDGTIKALSSQTSSMDGLDVHGGFIDELAAIKNRDIYDLTKQGMSARRQPLLVSISTNGFVRDNIFDSQYEYAASFLKGTLGQGTDRFLPFIYELDDREEWDKEECWPKANPGLGTIKRLDILRDMVNKAKDDPAFKPSVMVKDFNLIENVASAWLTWSDIETREPVPHDKGKTRPATFDLAEMGFDYAIGGIDAADSVDLNAAVILCRRRLYNGELDPRIYVTPMFWLPESVLEVAVASGNRRERDAVPYLLWEKRGLLRSVPGNKVDKQVMVDWFLEMREEHGIYTTKIGYDPYHVDGSIQAQFKAAFGQNSFLPIRQGVKTLSGPMKELKADLKANLIVHNQNPLLMWNMANVEVKCDTNGEIQPQKGIDPRKRIDGLAALLDAYTVLQDNRADYEGLI